MDSALKSARASSPQRVLVVAPHADDETLGLGGTICRHVAAGDEVIVAVMTGHGNEPHPLWGPEGWVRVRGEARRAMDVLGVSNLRFFEIPAVLVPDRPVWEVNKVTLELLQDVAPDVLYVPFPYDLHGDHRVIFASFSVAWRPITAAGRGLKRVYAYEVVSETHWNPAYLEPGFLPNHFVDISDYLPRKLEALACYGSQMQPFPNYRSLEAIEHQARLRGAQVGMSAAEAFVLVRSFDA